MRHCMSDILASTSKSERSEAMTARRTVERMKFQLFVGVVWHYAFFSPTKSNCNIKIMSAIHTQSHSRWQKSSQKQSTGAVAANCDADASSLCDITKGAKLTASARASSSRVMVKAKKATDTFKDTNGIGRRSILRLMFDAYATYASGIFWKIAISHRKIQTYKLTHICIHTYIYIINISSRYCCFVCLPCLRKLPKDNISYQLNTQKPFR